MWNSDPQCAGMIATHSRFEAMCQREETYNKRFGNTLVMRRREEPTVTVKEFDPRQKYNHTELNYMAEELLREDARAEVCRECGDYGHATGVMELVSAKDKEGTPFSAEFEQLGCGNGHLWWQGEGKERGIAGENPVLFEEHFAMRRRREIYTTIGTPDPSIVAGIYNRTHPQGRKVNSEEQRKRHGASFFR